MSDVTAAPAEAVAPSSNGGEQQPEQPPAQEQKADPRAELEQALKRAGGLKVKAGGREHTIDSLDKAMRYIQRGLPVEQSLEEVARARAEMEPLRERLERLKSGDDEATARELEEMLGEKFGKAAERYLRRQFEREQQMSGMSERERELARALEQERGEKQRLADERKRVEHEQRERAVQQQVQAIKAHIGDNIVKTLETLGLPPKLEPMAVEFMKPVIRAALNAGMPLDPTVLAEKVGPLFDEMLSYRANNLEGEALLKFFGDGVGRKFRAALLAQLNGGTKPVQPVQQTQTEPTKTIWDPRKFY